MSITTYAHGLVIDEALAEKLYYYCYFTVESQEIKLYRTFAALDCMSDETSWLFTEISSRLPELHAGMVLVPTGANTLK